MRSRPRLLLSAILAALGLLATVELLSGQTPVDPAKRLGAGKLLAAGEEMLDPNFAQAVVLLLSYGNDGALGIIINRRTRVRLADVLPESDALSKGEARIFQGGPVAPAQTLFLFRGNDRPERCTAVLEDVCTSGSRELLEELSREAGDGDRLRLYAGYAGWARGQLEWEIEQGGWHIFPGTAEEIFTPEPSRLWSELIERTKQQMASSPSSERIRPDTSTIAR